MSKEKTFEEQFPELKELKYDETFCECCQADIDIGSYVIDDYEIKKHCLSKQRVKEAILNLKNNDKEDSNWALGYEAACDNILKELGLGDEE